MATITPNMAGNRYNDTTWRRVPDRPPASGRMQTKDGYVIFAAADDHHFRAFRELMGKPDWIAGDEWDNREYRSFHMMDIAPQMEAWIMRQEKEDLHRKLSRAGIPIGPVNTAKDVMESRQYAARGYFVEVDHPEAGRLRQARPAARFSETPTGVKRGGPALGEHTREVLAELGYSDDDITRLIAAGGGGGE